MGILRERATIGKTIFHTSIENAFYFSLATFALVWIASLLYNKLEKTPGRLSTGAVMLIVLSLVLVMFLIALANIFLSNEESSESSFLKRLSAIFLFALVSVIILVILGVVFLYPTL